MSNILIVESKNDKCFVEALIRRLNLQNIEIDEPLCRVDDYECLDGVNQQKIIAVLKELRADLSKKDIQKVGIILDHDGRQEEKFNWVNHAIMTVFGGNEQIANTRDFISIAINRDEVDSTFRLACFLTHVNEMGELETLLKAIKTKPSLYADCLENWKSCLETEGQTISQKDFDKFWVSNYIRYDTCSNEEKNQAGRKCSMSAFEYVMTQKLDIWDLDHHLLDDFKTFLNLFV